MQISQIYSVHDKFDLIFHFLDPKFRSIPSFVKKYPKLEMLSHFKCKFGENTVPWTDGGVYSKCIGDNWPGWNQAHVKKNR